MNICINTATSRTYNSKKDYKFNELSNKYNEYLHKDEKLLVIQ